mgnify:CR=1 FL=1
MKYRVIWHDAEDDCTGTSFEVEDDDIKKAYYKAEEHIKGISETLRVRYWGLDIECLIDEKGNHHNPDFFLDDEKVKGYKKFCEDMKVKHEFKYDSSMGIYRPSSELTTIVNDPAYICERIPDEEGKREINFRGYCDIHTSAEWHTINYILFNQALVLDRGEGWPSSSTKPHLITKSLMTLKDIVCFELSRDANITHVIRHDYRKDKDFKEYSHNTDVYQFEPDGKRIFGEEKSE